MCFNSRVFIQSTPKWGFLTLVFNGIRIIIYKEYMDNKTPSISFSEAKPVEQIKNTIEILEDALSEGNYFYYSSSW